MSPDIDRVVSTSCFYPVKYMKGVVGHSSLWWAAYRITPAWNTESPSENHTNWSARPVSSPHTAHLQLQRDLGHRQFLFISLCISTIWGWKPRLIHSHLKKATAAYQGVFVDLVNKNKSRFPNTVCHTVFLHLPICNITVPKSYLLLHVCNQFVSRSSNGIRSGCLESKNKHISQSHCNISSSMLFDQCPQAFFHSPDCFGSTTIAASLHILR